jgi:hypothetical protein
MNTILGTVIIRCLDRLFFTHWRVGGDDIDVDGVDDVGVAVDDVGVGVAVDDVLAVFFDTHKDETFDYGSEALQKLPYDHQQVWMV